MFTRKKDKMRPPSEGRARSCSPKSSSFFTKAECGQLYYTPNPDNTNYSHPLVVRYIYE